MNYLSACSGIEAATVAWHPLGWEPVAFSEIEKFPSAVLKHHYPTVPNLGDMTKFKEWPDFPGLDLVVGGCPCQSFSVAGLRRGLADPRGNLTLTFLGIVDRYKPRWVVYENVPGIISDKTRALNSLLDGLEELGYIVDIEILDAQFHGVPQRRRRVFICAQSREDLLRKTTDSSALTIAQCLLEILHGILGEVFSNSVKGRPKSMPANLSKDGVIRRMKLFGILGGNNFWPRLQEHLEEAFQRFLNAQKSSAAPLGESERGLMWAGQSTASTEASPFTLTGQRLRLCLDESYATMRSFTTSMETSWITEPRIFICSVAALYISKLIGLLGTSSPPFWSTASSALTLLKECIGYARQANDKIPDDLDRVLPWGNFIREAESTVEIIGNIRVESFGEVLPFSDCLSGNPPPSRKTGQEVAPTVRSGAANGGPGHGARSGDSKDELIVPVHTTGAGFWQKGCGTLRGREQDSHENLVFGIDEECNATEDGFGPLLKGGQGGTRQAVAYGGNNTSGPVDVATACNAKGGSGRMDFETETLITRHLEAETITKVLNGCADGDFPGCGSEKAPTSMCVRRITPTEAERLQGFPDGYTNIPWKRKPESPDGPRYKALGNSMAVPVMRWIGKRILEADR